MSDLVTHQEAIVYLSLLIAFCGALLIGVFITEGFRDESE